MNTEKSRALLYKSADFISNEGIRQFTLRILDDVDDSFWKAPSSSTGNNHSPENNNLSKNALGEIIGEYGEGGLARHSVKVALVGYTIGYHFIPDKNILDTIVSSCILHDIKKRGKDGSKDFEPEHPIIASKFIDKYYLEDEFKVRIKEGIRYHMNNLTFPESERKKALSASLPFEYRIVQIADIVSSRRSISFFPGLYVDSNMLDRITDEKLGEIINSEEKNALFHRSKYKK
jgi:hypothetical protein